MPGNPHDRQYWDQEAASFEKDALYVAGSTIYQEVQMWLLPQFHASDVVVELACSTGFFSAQIAGRVSHLYATDFSPQMVDLARRRLSQYPNVSVLQADAYHTFLDEDTFDVVLLGDFLHIAREPLAVLRECRRIVKGGGRLVLVDVTEYGMTPLRRIALALRYMSRFGALPFQSRNFNPVDLSTLVETACFSVEDVRLVGSETKAICLLGAAT